MLKAATFLVYIIKNYFISLYTFQGHLKWTRFCHIKKKERKKKKNKRKQKEKGRKKEKSNYLTLKYLKNENNLEKLKISVKKVT